MKKLLLLLAVALAALGGLAYLVHRLIVQGEAGYLIIGYGHWSLETSLLLAGVVLLLAFIALYAFLRGTFKAASLPKALKKRGELQRSKRSEEALLTGLIETAEGNWESAERNLIRHAANSGVPLINYLTAARAAHSRGAPELRDEYLKLAKQTRPDAEMAIALTRAELQLSNKQFGEALENLTELNRLNPTHAAVLRLMHQAYAQMEDWEGLQRLIPALNKNKVLMEAEIRRLEVETFTALLKQRAQVKNPVPVRELWTSMPAHVRENVGIESLYFAAMIDSGAGAEVEESLRRALAKDWNQTLMVLYGCLTIPDPAAHLAHAEEWLSLHPNDAVLLRTLGKLALRTGQRNKARDYFRQSLDSEPSVEAYQLLGDLLLDEKDSAGAAALYRKGLIFISGEVVAEVEQTADAESLSIEAVK